MNFIVDVLIVIGITACVLAVNISVKYLCRKLINQHNSHKQ